MHVSQAQAPAPYESICGYTTNTTGEKSAIACSNSLACVSKTARNVEIIGSPNSCIDANYNKPGPGLGSYVSPKAYGECTIDADCTQYLSCTPDSDGEDRSGPTGEPDKYRDPDDKYAWKGNVSCQAIPGQSKKYCVSSCTKVTSNDFNTPGKGNMASYIRDNLNNSIVSEGNDVNGTLFSNWFKVKSDREDGLFCDAKGFLDVNYKYNLKTGAIPNAYNRPYFEIYDQSGNDRCNGGYSAIEYLNHGYKGAGCGSLYGDPKKGTVASGDMKYSARELKRGQYLVNITLYNVKYKNSAEPDFPPGGGTNSHKSCAYIATCDNGGQIVDVADNPGLGLYGNRCERPGNAALGDGAYVASKSVTCNPDGQMTFKYKVTRNGSVVSNSYTAADFWYFENALQQSGDWKKYLDYNRSDKQSVQLCSKSLNWHTPLPNGTDTTPTFDGRGDGCSISGNINDGDFTVGGPGTTQTSIFKPDFNGAFTDYNKWYRVGVSQMQSTGSIARNDFHWFQCRPRAKGNIDNSCGIRGKTTPEIKGWACDTTDQDVQVEIWRDGMSSLDGGVLVGQTTANYNRLSDSDYSGDPAVENNIINVDCRGKNSRRVGWKMDVSTDAGINDGLEHTIYAFVTDSTGQRRSYPLTYFWPEGTPGIYLDEPAYANRAPAYKYKCAALIQEGSILVHAFEDKNNNTSQDAGEGDLPGASIKLRRGTTPIGSAQTTNGAGETIFANLQPASNYSVSIDGNPAGYSLAGSTTNPQGTTVLAGIQSIVRFGFMKNVSIRGRVYFDDDFSSTINGGDTGYGRPKQDINMRALEANKSIPVPNSGPNAGEYVVDGLKPGTNTLLIEGSPYRHIFAFPTPSAKQVSTYEQRHELNALTDLVGIDFLIQPYPMRGKVFEDRDRNGVWSVGEPLVGGARITIHRNINNPPADQIQETLSQSAYLPNISDTGDPNKQFNYVLAAHSSHVYFINLVQDPSAYSSTYPGSLLKRRTSKYNGIPANIHDPNDFGLVKKGKIEGTVYLDNEFNLCQSGMLPASKTVSLRNLTDPTDVHPSQGGVGSYFFQGLIGTQYEVSTTFDVINGETVVARPYNNFQRTPFIVNMATQSDHIVNFCITTLSEWFQTMGGDVRYARVLNATIPPLQKMANNVSFPSIFFSSTGQVNIKPTVDQISSQKWKAERDLAAVTKSSNGQLSYSFYTNLIKRKGLPVESLPGCNVVFSTCALNSLSSGIYHVTDSAGPKSYVLKRNGPGAITIGANEKVILLVNGSVDIQSPISVGQGGLFILATSEDITVATSIGTTNSDDVAANAQLQGIFSAQKDITIPSDTGGCSTGTNPDRRLNIAGSLIANAAKPFDKSGGGQFSQKRSLCPDANLLYPAVKIFDRPDFFTALEDTYKNQRSIWKEIQPR